jgi:peroxin-5
MFTHQALFRWVLIILVSDELNSVIDWPAAGIQPVQLTPEERARMETAFRTQPVPHAYQGLPGEFPSRSATEIVPQVGTMPDMRNFAMRFGMDSPPLFEPPVQPILDVKGNGKLMQLDDTKWEEQFRALADSIRDQGTTKVEDFEQDSKKFLFEDVDQTPNDLFSGQGLDWDGTDLDFVDRFLEEPNSTFDGKPDLGEYMFEPENPWIFHEHPFEEGIRIMENGGSLSMAALAFELVCQLEPRRVEGWTLLGIVQAQNEKELAAIRACEQALRLDESNLEALMVSIP